jgi:uncharacterized protein YndB with AHSA1/START domain
MSAAEGVVIERTFRATLEEVWDLWTTKDGFESWWGPEGFRVEVHELDARAGGALRYDMIADTPEMVTAMKNMGQPAVHKTRGVFTDVVPHKRIVLTHVIDFFVGKPAFDNVMTIDLHAADGRVRMTVALGAMGNHPELGKMQQEGFTSQLRKLERRFATG